MKKFIYTIAILAVAMMSHSCINDYGECPELGDGQGAASINIGYAGDTRAAVIAGAYPGSNSDVRIYDSAGELVRRYTSLSDVPTEIWLVTGTYRLDVTLGVKETPTHTHPYYHGSENFEVKKNATTDVSVNCTLQNTAIKVNFDSSVRRYFEEYAVKVMSGDSFDEKAACLTFDAKNINAYGYLILPEGDNKISFRFDGELFDEGGTMSRTYNGIELEADKLKGYCHTLNIKYTESQKDQNGYISWNIKLEIVKEETHEDIEGINPAPRPTIEGSGWSVDEPKNIVDGATYIVSASDKDIQKITVSCDRGQEIEIDCSTPGDKGNGISIEYLSEDELSTRAGETDKRNIKLVFGSAYFNSLAGGEHTLTIRAFTSDTVFGEVQSKVRVEGIFQVVPDEWNGKAVISGYGFGSDVKIEYQKQGTNSWSNANATSTSEGVYSATATIEPATTYEYRLSSGGAYKGGVISLETSEGPQIPNAGFEDWSTQGSARCPYIDTNNQWWDTGNAAAAQYVGNNTNDKSESRPESQGTTCAELASKWALIKLAAGNIFIGKFVALDGTDGVVAFGKPFDFKYRPKAVRFWYKSKVGNINRVKNATPNDAKSGDPDCVNIYVCLTKMGGPHIVNTSKKETYMSFDEPLKTISYCTNVNGKNSTNDKADGHVIAYNSWDGYESKDEWTKFELELKYNEEWEGEEPNYIMFTASSNKYGDYYTGCDSNELYLDDIELVY